MGGTILVFICKFQQLQYKEEEEEKEEEKEEPTN